MQPANIVFVNKPLQKLKGRLGLLSLVKNKAIEGEGQCVLLTSTVWGSENALLVCEVRIASFQRLDYAARIDGMRNLSRREKTHQLSIADRVHASRHRFIKIGI